MRLRLVFTAVFLTACLAVPADALRAPASRSAPAGTYSFVSAPNLNPPRLQVLTRQPGSGGGDFLLTSPPIVAGGRMESWGGPLVVDSHAQPVWFTPSHGSASYLEQGTYEGKPILLWEEGTQNPHVVIVNQHYRRIASVTARSPWSLDLHDAWVSGGDIWLTVGREVPNQDLTPYGGPPDGTVVDEGLQEFQISTGQLIQTWDALNPGGKPNVPLSASEQPANQSWDPYHLNSVEALPNGALLVSMRNTSAVYLINPRTNRIIWTLGGKYSSFTAGPGATFIKQHDARLVRPATGGQGQDVELTLFNNNVADTTNQNPSEGMVLSLNTVAHRATLVRAYGHHPPLTAYVEGSMQLLPNGHAVVGWGSEPFFSEYGPSGRQLLDVRWPGADTSYRALFTDTWIGTPYYPPSGAVRGSKVYASWNGATNVAKWEVLAGSSAANLKTVARGSRTGFETALKLSRTYRAYEVRALTGNNRVLGTSKPFS